MSELPPNWGTAALGAPETCPVGGWDQLHFGLNLVTNGNPVLMTIGVDAVGQTAGASFAIVPLIDGQFFFNDRQSSETATGGEAGGRTVTQIYPLSARQHTFQIGILCEGSVLVEKAWVTVYELPSLPRH